MAKPAVRFLARIVASSGMIVAAGALYSSVALSQNSAGADDIAAGEHLFASTCAGCHGTDLAGGRGPSLFDKALLAQLGDAKIVQVVEEGIAGTEMPPFQAIYSPAQIGQIIAYLHSHADEMADHPPAPGGGSLFADAIDPDGTFVHSEKQDFRIHAIAKGLETPWGMAFLPDGRILVTERPGRLRIVDADGTLLPDAVKGTPTVFARQDGGLLDIAIDPDYENNGWIYLSYSELKPGVEAPPPVDPSLPRSQRPPSPPTMTVLVRGRLNDNNEWVDTQDIYRPSPDLYTASGSHYGTRFLFDGEGHLFFSLGERGDMANARRLDVPLGKIHRVNRDGSIPSDNPFAGDPGAVGSIWSYGHRNPQGLAFDPVTGVLWESEHGPSGGDEINVIKRGGDYGWGVVSMGSQPGITQTQAPGTEPPAAWYTPTIAPSGMNFYTGDRYPGWKNNLFVAALRGQELRRLVVNGDRIESQEVLFHNLGRVRTVVQGPDGLLYLLMQTATGPGTGTSLSASTPGQLIRLEPEE